MAVSGQGPVRLKCLDVVQMEGQSFGKIMAGNIKHLYARDCAESFKCISSLTPPDNAVRHCYFLYCECEDTNAQRGS